MQHRKPTLNDVQVTVSSLLVTRKEALTTGIPLAVLDNDYREHTGTRIPFRQLGHASLVDFLQSMEGRCTIKYRNGGYHACAVANEKTAHVSALVAGQNSKRNTRGGRRTYRPSPCYPRVEPMPVRLDSKILGDIVKIVKNTPDGKRVDHILEYARDRLSYNIETYDLLRQLREVSHAIVVEGDMIYPAGRQRANFSPQLTSAQYENLKPAGYSDSDPDGEENDYVARTTKKPESQPKNDTMPERSDETRQADDNYCDCETGDAETIAVLIGERTRIRLSKLIQNYPNGIWCAELPELYRKEYTIPLNYEELGFGSVSDFATYLPEIFHCVRPQDNGDFKLFDAKGEMPRIRKDARPKGETLSSLHNIYEQYVEPTEPIPSVLLQETLKRLVPDGVMTIGETVAQICVTELDRGLNEYIDVLVVDVFTPSFFWIQLLKRIPRFGHFMDELHAFYEIHAHEYTLPIAIMEKGLNCACKYDEKWHRGIIKTVRPDSQITVMFYDYGTVQTYPASCIHFLHRSFSNLPAQAIPCGLHNVKPLEGTRWSRNVSCEFVAKATNVPLAATIASIDTENNSMMVALTNTEGSEDFHINDWMVQSGMAVYGKMVCIRPPNYPYQRFLECDYVSSTIRAKDNSSYDTKNVKIEKIVVTSDAGLNNEKNVASYNFLLKLHLASKSGKNTSELSLKERNTVARFIRGKRNFFNNVQSQTGNDSVAAVVTSNFMTNDDARTGRNGVVRSASGKFIGTGLTRESGEARARRDDTWSTTSNNDSMDERKDETYIISGATTSSSSIDLPIKKKNELVGHEDENDEEVVNEADIQAIPLHLRQSDITMKFDEFGTMRSRLGGHGRMEPINWSNVRSNDKIDDKMMELSQESKRLSTMRTILENDFSKAPRKERDSSSIISNRRIKKTREDEKSNKYNTDDHANIVQENENKVITNEHSPTMSKFLMNKRILMNIVKNKEREKKTLGISEISSGGEIRQEFVNEVDKIMEPSITKFERKIFGSSDMENSDFGKFYSKCGGNGRSEPVAWSELRRIINGTEKMVQVSTEASSPTGKSRKATIPPNLSDADKIIMRIINETILSDFTHLESIWLPEGNIKMGSDVTPLMRLMKKRLDMDRNVKVNIFIPNDILEFMKSDLADENSTSIVNSSIESRALDESLEANCTGQKNAETRKNNDKSDEKNRHTMKTIISLKNTSESLLEMSESTNSQRDSAKVDERFEQFNSTRSFDRDTPAGGDDSSLNSLNSPHEILPFSASLPSTTMMGKSSSPIEIYESVEGISSNKARPRVECLMSPKDTNAWLQSVYLKPNSKQLSKLIGTRLDSTNDSVLDSDDLSVFEGIETEKKTTKKVVDLTSPRNNLKSKVLKNIEDHQASRTFKIHDSDDERKKKIKDVDSSKKNLNMAKIIDEKPNMNDNELLLIQNSTEKSEDPPIFVNSEIVKSSLTNDTEFAAELARNSLKNLPRFNDLDVKSDDEEWDYSPGILETRIAEINKNCQIETMIEYSQTMKKYSRLERISSCDESSLDITDNVGAETSVSGSSRQETDTDTTPIDNKYHLIGDQSDADVTRNSTFVRHDSTIDNSYIHKTPRPDYFPADQERLIDPDQRSNSYGKTFNFMKNNNDDDDDDTNPDERKSIPGIRLEKSILNEIKKSKIFNMSDTFVNLDNSSSSENSDSNYSSLISAFRRYF